MRSRSAVPVFEKCRREAQIKASGLACFVALPFVHSVPGSQRHPRRLAESPEYLRIVSYVSAIAEYQRLLSVVNALLNIAEKRLCTGRSPIAHSSVAEAILN